MTQITLNNTTLSYHIDGSDDSPWLIMSNSLGSDMRLWDKQCPALAQRYRVLRYDTRGHGGSDTPPDDYRLEELGADVIALMDALDIRAASFCGLSLGGMTGMWLAANAPARFYKVALCNTSAYLDADIWQTRIDAVSRNGLDSITDAVIERWFTAEFIATHETEIETMKEMYLSTDSVGYVQCCAAIRDMDLRPELAKIKTPILVIAGAEDQATPLSHAEYIAENISGAELSVFPNAAHLSNIEQPDLFIQALMGFLKS